MAEFAEVMRQAHRICKTHNCGDCPMRNIGVVGECELRIGAKYTYEELLVIEQTVMQWAKEHPDPQYPTWKEWQNENFPDAPVEMSPCSFMSRERQGNIMGKGCEFLVCSNCISAPIPADIAEKLGIRPKEV